jgi:hypothetical protein
MDCPYGYLENGEQFSEWRKECQECCRYNECLMGADMLNRDTYYPTYEEIHARLKKYNDIKEMISKRKKTDDPVITAEDIEDLTIEIGLHNERCKKTI